VNIIQFIAFGILPIAYFIIFSTILSSFLIDIDGVEDSGWKFIGDQWFSVIVLALIIFFLIIKKQISELSLIGALLFVGVILFNVLLFVMKIADNDKISYQDGDSYFFFRFRFNRELISSLSTAFVAYGFQSAFFPIYNSLENKSYKQGMKFSFLGMGFCLIIYICITFTGLYAFGIKTQGDVLDNISEVEIWESYVLRSIFLLILITHTPFTFFIGKEAVLCLAVLICQIFKKSSPYDNNQLKNEDETSIDNRELLRNIEVNQSHINSPMDKEKSLMNKSENTKEESHLDDNAPAYKLLPNVIYYPATIGLFIFVVGAACVIRDVEQVIKYIGSLGNSILNFVIPGVCYFVISGRHTDENTPKFKRYCALALAIYGGGLALILTGVNIWTTIIPLEDDFSRE